MAMINKKTLIVTFCFFLVSCASLKKTTEDLEKIYSQGNYYLSTGNIKKAEELFLQIQSVNPQSAPAYEGLGRVYLYKKNIKLAEVFFRKSIVNNKRWYPAYTGLGRVLYMKGDYEEALNNLKISEKERRSDFENTYYMGLTYKKMGNYSQALSYLEKARNFNPGHEDVKNEIEEVKENRSKLSGYPSVLEPVDKIETVNRGQFSALLDYVLGGKDFYSMFDEKRSVEIRDKNSLGGYKEYILKVVTSGLLNLYPDNTFRFNEPITKSFLAIVIQNILVAKTGNQMLETMYLDNPSPFPDVPNSHYAFNAVMVGVTRGIMQGKIDGTFGASDILTGKEVVEILNKLKKELDL